MSPTTLVFAGNNIQTSTYITSDIDHESLPTKDDVAYKLSHASNSAIPFVSYPSKPIKLKGYIISSTKQLQEANTDLFKSYFNTTSGFLDIGYNGGTRRYVATADKIPVVRPLGLTLSQFEVDMTATPGWGMDNFTTNLYTSSGTAQSFQQTVTFSGSAPWQAPIATFTLQTFSGTNGAISFGNAFTGQQATISGSWTANSIIVFDSTLNQVTINGAIAQFSGALPQFQPGSGTFTYSDNFSVRRSYLYTVAYTARYD